MSLTHEVLVYDHVPMYGLPAKHPRNRWYACEVIARRPAPASFRSGGHAEAWYDVQLLDGKVYRFCNPDCVRSR